LGGHGGTRRARGGKSQICVSGGFQFDEEAAAFGGGVVVILGDGEIEGFVEPAAGVSAAGELEEGLTEKEAGQEPVGATGGAKFEVLKGFGGAAFLKEGLAEAEAEEEVAGLGGDAVAEGVRTHKERLERRRKATAGGLRRKRRWR
jgi:hypothetical protein